ncbi:chaperonin 10-like protein [Chaetomium fimeti]|uniref:Chaperonin 10-like protein n=1 Tax=Chaetomium fimeti TaxID=1854472 RepID=A0AAE0H9S8_9PEZI|nr:chaperonin 10-like protein [Chaetomium fimeti]
MARGFFTLAFRVLTLVGRLIIVLVFKLLATLVSSNSKQPLADMASASGTQGTRAEKKTMRAVVWEGKPYEMAVRDVPRPEIIQSQDAIVRITTAAICGTDLHTYHGTFGSATPPWSMGHEAVGVIVEVGQSIEHFKVGNRVIVPFSSDCGFLSVEQRFEDQGAFYGEGSDFGSEGGAQAEYLRVPFADDSLVAIPDDFSSDLDWLFLSDVFVTAWTGLDYAHFQAGDAVAVFGAGPIGLMCAYSAILRGASKVYAIDHVRDRLDKAASIGAIPIDFSSEAGTASEQILRREPLGVERSVECVGQECLNHDLKPEQNYVIQETIRVTKYNGGIGILGLYIALGKSEGTPRGELMDKELSISIPAMFRKNLSIGSGPVNVSLYEVMPRVFELVKSGRAKLSWIVTSQVGIEDAPKAYDRFDKKLEIKVVIRFPWVREQPVQVSSEPVAEVETAGEEGSRSEEKSPVKISSGRKKPRRPSQS